MNLNAILAGVGFVAHNRDRIRRKIWGKHYTFDKRGATRRKSSKPGGKSRRSSGRQQWSHGSTIR